MQMLPSTLAGLQKLLGPSLTAKVGLGGSAQARGPAAGRKEMAAKIVNAHPLTSDDRSSCLPATQYGPRGYGGAWWKSMVRRAEGPKKGRCRQCSTAGSLIRQG